MTFRDLFMKVLQEAEKPLTVSEIWAIAEEKGYVAQVNSSGKTPKATMAAQLYTLQKQKPELGIALVQTKPKRFQLEKKKNNHSVKAPIASPPLVESPQEPPRPASKPKQKMRYLEKHLHPFLAQFAKDTLGCYCKTINHSNSTKKTYGQWVHPDMVGCKFPFDKWNDKVTALSESLAQTAVKFYSFELKQKLDLGSIRENFFQTVSNSSWANEGYLVAAEISEKEDFQSELRRLSVSFGIGIIKLDVSNPKESQILYPAAYRENLDWETIDKLATMNKDFIDFTERVKIDIDAKRIHVREYDKIFSVTELVNNLEKQSTASK